MNHSIVIADDHPLLLKGLYDFLVDKKFNVTGKYTNGNTVYNAIIKDQPDIAILDIEMPKLSGLEVAQKCKANKLPTKIIFITLHLERELYKKAKELNVFGYLLKDFAIEEIECCLQSVMNNVPYFSSKITSYLNIRPNENKKLALLTPSEKKILRLIAKDQTNKEIGELLFISSRTVEKHRSNIISKLELSPKTNSLLLWAKDHQSSLL